MIASSPTTIGLNLSWLQPGRVGGTESYARRVIAALVEHVPELDVHAFVGPAAVEALRPAHGGFEFHVLPSMADHVVGRVLAERSVLGRAFRAAGVDVDHHLGGTVPFRSARPTVVTIHDLQPLADPGNFGPIKRTWLARAIPRAVARADVVTTPSEWVAAQVIDRFGIDAERVCPVPAYAISRDRAGAQEQDRSAGELSASVRQVLRRGPVLLYPAMTMSHKNHLVLFAAFARAVARRPDLQLVCVGPRGRDHDEIVAAAAAVSPRIHLLGFVSTNDLAALYADAELLVFPSRHEGFGLPVLEAQRASLPVVASSATAIPEVAGDGAILVGPDDLDAWVDAVASPLPSARRTALIDAGLTNVARFTARRTAMAQCAAYRLAVDSVAAS